VEYYADGSVTSANRSAASRISTASLPAAGARRHLLAGDGGAGFRRLASGCGSEGPQGQRGARRLGVSRGRLCWLVLERVIRIRVGLRTVGEVLDRSATPPERRNQTASRAGRARSRAAGAAEAVDAVHQGEQRISEERDRLVRHGEDRADPGDRRSPRAPCTWFHPPRKRWLCRGADDRICVPRSLVARKRFGDVSITLAAGAPLSLCHELGYPFRSTRRPWPLRSRQEGVRVPLVETTQEGGRASLEAADRASSAGFVLDTQAISGGSKWIANCHESTRQVVSA